MLKASGGAEGADSGFYSVQSADCHKTGQTPQGGNQHLRLRAIAKTKPLHEYLEHLN